MKLLAALYFSLQINLIFSSERDPCKSKGTCSECIQQFDCIWCVKPSGSEASSHCISEKTASQSWCAASDLINAVQDHEVRDNRSLSTKEGQIVQIRPQRLWAKLRVGEEFTFEFQYGRAKNYPIDLYYMMDLSRSMYEHKTKLAELGEKLAETMVDISSNFRLGFGSFVDKVALPFTSTAPDKLTSPCKDCAPPYSYKHHMNLSQNYEVFSERVRAARISGNLDPAEGGFDALMQAIVCKDKIGWRTDATHLLVFSTDQDFHIAGDGKLAGVLEPNDGLCHMEQNEYKEYLKYDYPSVSHINWVARENNINIIFAVASRETQILEKYKLLQDKVENSNVGVLDENSANVINLVLDNYNKIVDSVTFNSDAPKDIEVKISSTCPQSKENGCTNISLSEVVNFKATIKPLECTGSNRRTIKIKPEGLEETITVDLEISCNCDSCESASKANVSECSYNGILECGTCKCSPGRFGQNCECDRSSSFSEDVRSCKEKETDTEWCSGFGSCICGKCECYKRLDPSEKIDGKFCQCHNYTCRKINGLLCAGNGICKCGNCECYNGWTGEFCDCPTSKASCILPGSNGLICSGHGECKCGRCSECFDKNRFGRFCEECPSCKGQRCEELKYCVDCLAFGPEPKACNCSFSVTKIDKITEDSNEETDVCRHIDDASCTMTFEYFYKDNGKELAVNVEKEKACPILPNVVVWILGVVATILFAGLALLIIWKVATTIHDKREYIRFEQERQNMRWHQNENPLFRQPVSTFANPAYNRRSKRLSRSSSRRSN